MRVTTDAISVSATCRIGHVSLVLENEVGGTWGVIGQMSSSPRSKFISSSPRVFLCTEDNFGTRVRKYIPLNHPKFCLLLFYLERVTEHVYATCTPIYSHLRSLQ